MAVNLSDIEDAFLCVAQDRSINTLLLDRISGEDILQLRTG